MAMHEWMHTRREKKMKIEIAESVSYPELNWWNYFEIVSCSFSTENKWKVWIKCWSAWFFMMIKKLNWSLKEN